MLHTDSLLYSGMMEANVELVKSAGDGGSHRKLLSIISTGNAILLHMPVAHASDGALGWTC